MQYSACVDILRPMADSKMFLQSEKYVWLRLGCKYGLRDLFPMKLIARNTMIVRLKTISILKISVHCATE
jgi:hypothetical protein